MQTVRVQGACLVGAGAELVTVEARFDRRERERTEVVLTGLPDPVLRESRGRLVCALEANGLHLPRGRLFLNLVPAGKRKSGEILDLPLALAAAIACGHLEPRGLAGALFLGEVGIDGRLHAVPGGLAAALAARAAGIERVIAPRATAQEAAWIPGVSAFAADDLEQVVAHLCDGRTGVERVLPPDKPSLVRVLPEVLDQVRGQAQGKLALAVAAAGGHALLFVGAPGAGKTMLAERLRALCPAPGVEERLAITRVLSAIGKWPGEIASDRPFRAPHHTVSFAGLVGGGSPPQPGEITLAHCGILFLDELPEFRREVLEALRQPLESGAVTISRAGWQLELPARFLLVAAMNPCPCGWHGHPQHVCRCPPSHVQRYRARISGPLLDRIDLRVELTPPQIAELAPSTAARAGPTGRELFERVAAARRRMSARQGALANVELGSDALDRFAPFDAVTRELFTRAARSRHLSARSLQSLRKVARTLADLEDLDAVQPKHAAQALALRAEVP